MIGLKADEWDMIWAGLNARLENEWEIRHRGCECSPDECPQDEKGVFRCNDYTETIEKFSKLQKKVWLLKLGMEKFEQLLLDHEGGKAI